MYRNTTSQFPSRDPRSHSQAVDPSSAPADHRDSGAKRKRIASEWVTEKGPQLRPGQAMDFRNEPGYYRDSGAKRKRTASDRVTAPQLRPGQGIDPTSVSLRKMEGISDDLKVWQQQEFRSTKLPDFIKIVETINQQMQSAEVEFEEDIRSWCKHRGHVTDISFVLYNMGQFVSFKKDIFGTQPSSSSIGKSPNSPVTQLSSSFVNIIFSELLSHRKLIAKSTANALWGAGKLAEQRLLQKGIGSRVVGDLLEALPGRKKQCTPQAISNAFWGVSKMAEQGLFQEKIPATVVSRLLLLFKNKIKKREIKKHELQEISNTLWSVGKMVEQGLLLKGEIFSTVVQELLQALNSENCIPRDISNALWGVSKMAEKELLKGKISSTVVKELLQALNNNKDDIAQHISNALYGVGKMVEQVLLQEKISSTVVKELLRALAHTGYAPRDISNALYGVGKMAEQELLLLEEKISSNLVNGWFEEIRDKDKGKDYLSQTISNALWGVGKMAEKGLLKGQISSKVVTRLLQALQKESGKLQNISMALYGVGKMAEQGLLEGKISSTVVQELLQTLHSENCIPRDISNALWGVGKMVEKELLQEKISSNVAQELLQALSGKKCTTLDISHALWGAGKIVEQVLLQEKISSTVVNELLQELVGNGSTTPQHISNALYGAGKMAQQGLLQQGIFSDVINKLLQTLKDKDCIPLDISHALWGVGRLADKALLQEKMSSTVVNELLQELVDKGCTTPQHISNALYAVGKMAQQGLLQQGVFSGVVNKLLQALKGKDCIPLDISHALWGVGRLAEKELLQEELSFDIVNDLLTALNDKGKECKPHDISNALWGAGKLAEQELLQEEVSSDTVKGLLTALNDKGKECKPQNISTALCGVGKMAQQELLQQDVFSDVVNRLIQVLKGKDCIPQAISNALWGAGRLAEKGLLQELSFDTINDLLTALNGKGKKVKPQEIGNALWGVGKLAAQEVLKGSISSEQVDSVLKKLGNLDGIDQEGKIARQILFGLLALEYTQLSPEMVTKLVKSAVISADLNPLEAIRAMRFLAMFSSEQLNHTEINTLFLELLDGMNRLPKEATSGLIEHFSQTYQNDLEESLNLLKEKNLSLYKAISKCFWNESISEPNLVANLSEEDVTPLEIESEAEYSERIEPVRSLLLHIRLRRNTEPLSTQRDTAMAQPTPSVTPLNIERDRPIVQPISSAGPLSIERDVPAAQPLPFSLRLHLRGVPIPLAFEDEYATQQLMFQYILSRNINELARILQYDLNRLNEARNEANNIGIDPPGGGNENRRAQAGNIPAVEQSPAKAFFERIPVRELTWLVQRPGISDSLRVLLHSCRKHTVYDLAKTTKFRRLYHMPLNELKEFMEWLKHPVMLHRDSRALLNAILAISLRDDFITRNNELYAIQRDLLTTGIQYHRSCRHHRVLSLLEQKERELAQNHMMILDTPEEVDTPEEDIELNADPSPPSEVALAGNLYTLFLLPADSSNPDRSASSSSSMNPDRGASSSSSRNPISGSSSYFSTDSVRSTSSSSRNAVSSSSSYFSRDPVRSASSSSSMNTDRSTSSSSSRNTDRSASSSSSMNTDRSTSSSSSRNTGRSASSSSRYPVSSSSSYFSMDDPARSSSSSSVEKDSNQHRRLWG